MFSKIADTSAPVATFLTRRWSGVAFDESRDISQPDILSLAEAARWAPSCFGDQPWRFIFCQKSVHPDAWQKAFDCLAEGNRSWNCHVPLLILICGDTLLTRNEKPNAYGEYDSGAAAVSLCLQAASLDIMTHQMAGFDKEKARELFSIPERFNPIAMMAVGYQLPRDAIPEDLKNRETAPRNRRDLAENFFAGTWGTGL